MRENPFIDFALLWMICGAYIVQSCALVRTNSLMYSLFPCTRTACMNSPKPMRRCANITRQASPCSHQSTNQTKNTTVSLYGNVFIFFSLFTYIYVCTTPLCFALTHISRARKPPPSPPPVHSSPFIASRTSCCARNFYFNSLASPFI